MNDAQPTFDQLVDAILIAADVQGAWHAHVRRIPADIPTLRAAIRKAARADGKRVRTYYLEESGQLLVELPDWVPTEEHSRVTEAAVRRAMDAAMKGLTGED